MRKTITMIKYGAEVIADVELESMRSAGCLCLRCVRMVTVEDTSRLCVDDARATRDQHAMRMARAFNCPTAQGLYDVCLHGDVATPVTRCPMFIEKS